LVSAFFFRVVAAYSLALNDLIAFSGRYRSPVAFGPWVDGLPLLVRHFCFVQASRLFCDFALLILIFYIVLAMTTRLDAFAYAKANTATIAIIRRNDPALTPIIWAL